MTILSEIFAHKRIEVAEQKQRVSTLDLLEQIETARPPLDFAAALRRSPKSPNFGAKSGDFALQAKVLMINLFYSWNNFSPARTATFKRFSAGVIGQDHISL